MNLLRMVREKYRRVWFRLRYKSWFEVMAPGAYVVSPFRVDGHGTIRLGSRVFVQEGAWLYAGSQQGQSATLSIGDGTVLGYRNHIAAVREVHIGRQVLTANNVYISDNIHAYEDPTTPIMDQPVQFKGAVSIGDGTWIGENACIIGARVGRNCVIGANAVVTKDIPDFAVAVGIPAVVIRQFDQEQGVWRVPPRA